MELINMKKFICTECKHEYDVMPASNECSEQNCGGFIHKTADIKVGLIPQDPIVRGENGLGIIAMDFSSSMDELAFPDEIEYTKSKANAVATALKSSIAKIKNINKADKVYMVLIGFTQEAHVLKVFRASDISEDKIEWDKFFTDGIEEFRKRVGEGTNITSALKLAREIYDGALRGDLKKHGIDEFAPMYQGVHIEHELYNVANIRVFIYSDGEHCVGEFVNHFEGASIIPGKTNISGLTAAYLGPVNGIGYPYMELIAGVCPRHGIKAVIHVDKSKNFDYLRDLFHMTTATSGLCAECAKELKKISAGER
jgi:hypothetical protein